MFKKLFGQRAGTPAASPISAADAARARANARAAAASTPAGAPVHPGEAALLALIAERLPSDPLIGAKLGGKEVYERLLRGLKTERGVHAESLLTALGALAGYSCQASVRAAAAARGLPESALLMTIETTNGQKYFYGETLNVVLAQAQDSVWGFAAGAAQQAGCASLPDVKAIFEHVAKSLGGPEFGVPRIPAGHAPQDTPMGFVRALWPALLPLVRKFCPDPIRWPALYGIALQNAIMAARHTLDPQLALTIVMESAVPMSKIDLAAGGA